MTIAATVRGIGLVGPGLAGWEAGREVLAGRAAFAAAKTVVPVPEALPSTERRRAGAAVKLALAAGLEAVRAAGCEPGECAAVFASSGGDAENCHAICEALASEDRLISPTRFHNSVHNAPAGYWGIATGATQAADCIAAFDASAAAGLLEALVRTANEPSRAVLLVAYDCPYPEPLRAVRPIADAFAVAMVLAADGAGPRVEASPGSGATDAMDDPGLDRLRRAIPAARLLPLLAAIARGSAQPVALEWLDGAVLHVATQP
ncbi:MAG TPA: beta-ketoacyl synthase chain length factor [Usitatibacter sp.]|nr:beta-ketoacyl synthase chain length factor [Usitatibacter sp.]